MEPSKNEIRREIEATRAAMAEKIETLVYTGDIATLTGVSLQSIPNGAPILKANRKPPVAESSGA